MCHEKWEHIKGYGKDYVISSKGRIKSYKWGKEKLLKQRIERAGYYSAELWKNSKGKTYFVHRLVCTAFHKNPKRKGFVNHKDGNKLNNAEWNVEWATRKENQLHAVRVLGKGVGETCGASTLSEEDVLRIRKLADKCTQKELGEMFSVHESNIGYILRRKTWRHI